VRKLRQSGLKQRIRFIKSKELQTKQRQKKFKQAIYLRKRKPTKGKADAEKGKQTDKKNRESMQQK